MTERLVGFFLFFLTVWGGFYWLYSLPNNSWQSPPLIITMAVAAFMIHGNAPFVKKEMALLYLLLFITILVFGGGKYAAGKYLGRK